MLQVKCVRLYMIIGKDSTVRIPVDVMKANEKRKCLRERGKIRSHLSRSHQLAGGKFVHHHLSLESECD